MKLPRPPIDRITLFWLDQRKEEHNLTDYEISLQLGQDRSYLGRLRNDRFAMSKGIRAALWHYFKRMEILKHFHPKQTFPLQGPKN